MSFARDQPTPITSPTTLSNHLGLSALLLLRSSLSWFRISMLSTPSEPAAKIAENFESDRTRSGP